MTTTNTDYLVITIPRHTNRFISAEFTDDNPDDPDAVWQAARKVAWTDRHPHAAGDANWADPTIGMIGTRQVTGAMTGNLTPGTRSYLWALPDDPDEHQPKLAAVIYME